MNWRDTLWGSGEAELPRRVADAIHARQDSGERLIGWIQLAVLLVFGLLYALGRKSFPPDAALRPVPWALGFYFLFTMLRIYWAHRARLPGFFVALSIVVDMGLLLALIFSFHIQYMQPPSFYLKAPTLLYVFIFIALRALRFEVRYILLAGAAAMIGWSFMVGYVMLAEPGNPMITRNYVTYLTSNSMLLGAEFDKIASILAVTIILAVAVERARRFLVSAVAEASAAQDLSQFFAPEIARTITAAEDRLAPGMGVLRHAVIMSIDLRGFTALSKTLAPDRLVALLGEYHARVVPKIAAHGGVVDKYLGDGILAHFGAVQPLDNPESQALLAAEAILQAVETWNRDRGPSEAPIRVGMGLAAGDVICGAIGQAGRLEFTVIGDAVNLAAKLEKHNKAEGASVTVTANMFETGAAQGARLSASWVKLENRTVAGAGAPMDLAVIVTKAN